MARFSVQKIVVIVVVLIIPAIVLGIFIKPRSHQPAGVAIDTSGQPMLGHADAKLQMVVFEDLKCIACKFFNNQLQPLLKEKYIDTGEANYTIVTLAFIPGSMPVANAALCLYQENPDTFFEFTHYVYQNQPPENEDWATIPRLVEFASHIEGIDTDKLSECIYNGPYTAQIKKNFELAKKVIGTPVATPALYINGRVVKPLTLERAQEIIQTIEKD